MSYQSSLSDIQGPFITAAKVQKKEPVRPVRPQSAVKEPITPLEPIIEEQVRLRCPSPVFKDTQALKWSEKPEKFEERLDVYLDEAQQYLDYLNQIEQQIKDNQDLAAITEMKVICSNQVTEHVAMCETVVADLVECNLNAREQIEAFKMLGIECDKQFEHNEQAEELIQEYRNRQLVKIDQEPKVKQKTIKAAK